MPSATSGTDSTASCRTILVRLAPRAMRTPNSRTRPVALDITRLPRFAAATIRTRPVRPPSSDTTASTAIRSLGLRKLWLASNGSSHSSLFTSGRSAAIACIVRRSDSRAAAAETPSRRRP